jgi:hypothetical protein
MPIGLGKAIYWVSVKKSLQRKTAVILTWSIREEESVTTNGRRKYIIGVIVVVIVAILAWILL